MMPIATRQQPTVRSAIGRLQEKWPVGTLVTHTVSGLRGVVSLDHPDRVPCTSLPGEASAWCLLPSITTTNGTRPGRGAAVHVAFHVDGVTWTAWIRTDYLARASVRRRSRKSRTSRNR
ncbi:hypothetical protein AB0I72_19680 [Nocardiopsis sp. NPDC049922]|uniref:hypothetical protein n=1 Tax=Nocardiopsis sp. NPDC049922 TaxID=3155157 RepID=UPI003407F81F